jgi:hypothetical protein
VFIHTAVAILATVATATCRTSSSCAWHSPAAATRALCSIASSPTSCARCVCHRHITVFYEILGRHASTGTPTALARHRAGTSHEEMELVRLSARLIGCQLGASVNAGTQGSKIIHVCQESAWMPSKPLLRPRTVLNRPRPATVAAPLATSAFLGAAFLAHTRPHKHHEQAAAPSMAKSLLMRTSG